LELQTATRLPSWPGWPVPAADDHIRSFLIESERRVILHCRTLLDDQALPIEERGRVMRLLGEAEERLQGIVA
jgi:hypothetical protein